METRIVLGIFPFHYRGPSVLVPVAAEVVDGRLTRVTDARARFPNNGEIFVLERNIPEGFGRLSAGVWEVRNVEESWDVAERGDRFAHFVSIASLTPPHEIVPVRCHSEDSDAARELLLGAIPLPYRLASDPFIEFEDGVVVGPVRTLLLPEGVGFRCADNALENPCRAWRSRAALEPLVVPNQTQTRSFVWGRDLPKPEFYLDLTPLQDAIRSVVKFVAKEGPGSYIIPKREQELLAAKLAAAGLPEWVEARRDRVLRLLKLSVETREQLDALMEILLEHPKVKERLEAEEKRVLETGKRNLQLQEDGLIKRIIGLNAEESRLNKHLEAIATKIAGEQARGLQQAEELEHTIRSRALKAKEEAGTLLADVAILQPFFGTNIAPAPIQNASSVMPVELQEWKPGATPKTFPEAVNNLQRNLGLLGLHPLSGRALARDVLAAVSSKQLVLFQGSIGSLITRIVARTLACQHVTIFKVPLGFREGAEFESVVREASREGCFTALIIEGANRSCLDAYGSFLTQLIADRIFGLGDQLPNLILLGNILDGPSSLPPGPGLTSLGPIFYTDCLTWMAPTANGKHVDGQLSALPAPDCSASPSDLGILNNWCKALCGTPSVLWARNVELAFKTLNCRPEKASFPSALESATFGWLLPRAVAMGVDMAECAQLLNDVRKDPRVESLLCDVMHLPARTGS